MSAWFAGFVFLVIGYWVGNISARANVAREIDRLGGFYVGKTVYKCTKEEK